ncbi:hypothetical protein [Sulfuricurvum sp.]|uniref:hypothetical protein n=1 Tax=Sulfuricurvum sp. TaxID=2025608 RepID=UPI00356546D1
MLRFVFQVSRLDGNTGLKTKGIETVDIDVPVLEGMLIKGGLSENSYEVHDLFGIEILTGKGADAQENKESGGTSANIDYTAALAKEIRQWVREQCDIAVTLNGIHELAARLNSVVKAQQNCA